MKKQMSAEEQDELVKNLSKFVMTGNYKDGVAVAKQALNRYPDDLVCQYQYAKLLGDWADELPLARRQKLKTEAARILKPLTQRLSGIQPEKAFGLCLNYYYQSSAFQDMYNFGKRFHRRDRRKGLYAQALGAVLHAEHLKSRGKPFASWAQKSVEAWKKYDLGSEPYYFAHYSFAKALALLGESKPALKSLQVAARKSKRKIDDWEFQDVLRMIRARESI